MVNKSKCSESQMLIRKSSEKVFNAFIDPEITTNFWFTKSSGKLKLNKEINWTWEMYNFTAKVIAKEIIPFKRIKFDWYAYDKPTKVVIDFKELNSISTFVSIVHSGFDNSGDELVEAIKDSTGGFTLLLAGLKCYLEHGINLNLTADKFPKEFTNHEQVLKDRISS